MTYLGTNAKPQFQNVIIQALLENLTEGIAFINASRDIVYVNPMMTKMTGLPAEGFLLSEFVELVRLNDPEIVGQIKAALENEKTTIIEEVKLFKFSYEMHIIPVFNNKSEMLGGAIILHDITKMKEVEEMKNNLVSIASHQLKSPITTLSWYTELLTDGDTSEFTVEQKDYLKEIDKVGKSMRELVNNFLNISRVETDRMQIDPSPMDLAHLIGVVVDTAKTTNKNPQASIYFEKPKVKLGKVPVDSLLLSQVIHNLISNALRYTQAGKPNKITVALNTGADISISVSDTGIGIPVADRNKIFEKFYRADNARKVVTEGSGLGLYLAKIIMQSAGGDLTFESEENKGTVFTISFPKTGMKAKAGEKTISPTS